jgi:hypothetical protein
VLAGHVPTPIPGSVLGVEARRFLVLLELRLRDSPTDLHSPKAPRILALESVTLRRLWRAFVLVMDPIRNRMPWGHVICPRSGAPPGPVPQYIPMGPAEFPSISGRAHVSATGTRVPLGGSRSPRDEEKLKGDRTGTD